MLDKDFDELSMKEKYTLQKIMKKQRNGEILDPEEQLLHDKHRERWAMEESKSKSKWPIVIGILLVSLFAILRRCQ